jgi:WD40 repeat protein
MGTLCSKSDKDDRVHPPRPVASVVQHTSPRAQIPGLVTPAVSTPLDSVAKAKSPVDNTFRISRLHADLISAGLKSGKIDFIELSSIVGTGTVAVDEDEPATVGGNDEETSSSALLETTLRSGAEPHDGEHPRAADAGPASSPSPDSATLPSPSQPQLSGSKVRQASSASEPVRSDHGPDPSSPDKGKKNLDNAAVPPIEPHLGQGRALPTEIPTNAQTAKDESRRVNRAPYSSRILLGHEGPVFSTAFCAEGSRLVSGSDDKTVRIWDPSTNQVEKIIEFHMDTVRAVAVSQGDNTLASASWDETVRVWDLDTTQSSQHREPSKTFLPHAKIMTVAFSSDGRYLAAGAQDNIVRVWDVRAGDWKLELRGHDGIVASVAFSPDGRYIASGSHDMTARIWDSEGGRHVATLDAHAGCVHAVAFSPNSARLASGSADKTVNVWRTTRGMQLRWMRRLRGHTDLVWSVAFSRQGDRLASGSADKTIAVWNLVTGQRIHVLRGHEDTVFSVAFSPCAYQLASASRDKTLRLWDIEDDSQLPYSTDKIRPTQ